MQTAKEKKYIEELKRIYKQADRICLKKKDADRETIVKTLFALKKTPSQRLFLGLLRGRNIKKRA